jgi:hypothetical protein
MWRRLIILGLLAGLGVCPVAGQQWSGTGAVSVSGGYQTNLYLDPVLGTWNPDVSPGLIALTPRVGVTRNTSRTRFDLTVRSRLHPRRSDTPQLTQTNLRFRYRLTPAWTLGASGGGTRYRFTTTAIGFTVTRDAWWLLPSVQWTPTDNTMLTLRTGLTQRFERSYEPTDRQTSGLVSFRAAHWLTERVRGSARVYYSGGRTSVAETGFGGTGGSLSATYWPTDAVSVRGTVAGEQLRYEVPGASDGDARDRIGRVEVESEWRLRTRITLFGRGKVLYAALDRSESGTTDLHVSAGLRLQLQRVLGGTSDPPPQQRVCRNTDEGLRLRVSYEGDGTPHVTGDFNGWALPGIPLERAEGDTWRATLDLPPGRYAYRLRAVEGDEERWIDLPSYAQTTQDSFGSTNGVCTVY